MSELLIDSARLRSDDRVQAEIGEGLQSAICRRDAEAVLQDVRGFGEAEPGREVSVEALPEAALDRLDEHDVGQLDTELAIRRLDGVARHRRTTRSETQSSTRRHRARWSYIQMLWIA